MVKVPDIDKIYALYINTKVFNKESLDFIGKSGFVIGSIKHKNPYTIWKKIEPAIIKEVGEEEWNNRNIDVYKIKIKRNIK